MFTLMRKEFPDMPLTREDLDALTDLWLAWHQQRKLTFLRYLESYHAIQLRLWGFPRQDGERLRQKLRQNLGLLEVFSPEIDASDPDYLIANTPFLDFSHPCSLGMCQALVDDPAFHGLVVILRLSVHDWPGLPEGPAKVGGTLVICGQLRQDGFLLKAIWPAGLERGIEGLYLNAVWPEQGKFLQGLQQFRETGAIPPPRQEFFATRPEQEFQNRIAKLIFHLPEQGRLSSFLFRASFHLVFLILLVSLQFQLPDFSGKATLILMGGGFSLTALGYVLQSQFRRVIAFHKRMNAELKRVFSQSLRFSEVNLAEEGLLGDPNFIKYSSELEAQGCRHAADVRLEPGPSGMTYTRIFVLPAERIYFFLNLMTAAGSFHVFPAKATYLVVTYLADGRVVTIGEGGGFRKRLTATVFSRRFPGIHDPAILLAKHRKFLGEICNAGHALAPFMDTRDLLKRMSQEHAETRELYELHGYYSWSAAIRQSFGLVRREFLEPGEDRSEGKRAMDEH